MSATILLIISLVDLVYITTTVSSIMPTVCRVLSWIIIFTNALSVCFTLRKHHSRQTINFVSSFCCQLVAVVWAALIFHYINNESSLLGIDSRKVCPIKVIALLIAVLLCCVETGRLSLVILLLRRQRHNIPRASILTLF